MALEYDVEIVTGVLSVAPVETRIVTEEHGPKWWRRRWYFLETEFGRIGPYGSFDEASQAKHGY